MGFKYLGESGHLQSLVNEDTVLFDMSNKNGQKKFFFFTFICFIGGMVLGVQLMFYLTYSFCFGNIKECLNAAFV